jgi:hypothetical protein
MTGANMFNRRDFLSRLVASPAAALVSKPSACLDLPDKVWVVVGVNWEYNDEVNCATGELVTEHVYSDKGLADQVCAELVKRFREEDDPDDYTGGDFGEPDGWSHWSKDQQWDWLFGLTECPDLLETAWDVGFAWIRLPFEVCELRLPASAVAQRLLAAERLQGERA